MYVTPAPSTHDDPLYAIRLAVTGVLALLAVVILNPALPPIIAALPIGLVAGQRKAFNLTKAIAGPITIIVLVTLMCELIEFLRPLPLVYVLSMWLIYLASFLTILKSGAPAGMLIIVITVLMSVMGMHGNASLEATRDGFIQASLVSLVIALIVYTLFPARTTEKHVDTPVPTEGNILVGAFIRASVLLMLSFWLYSVMTRSDIMLAIIAAMVIVFPTRQAVFFEAKQRIRATFYGGGIALAILIVFTFSSHLPILLLLIFMGGFWLGNKMLESTRPSMVYQYAFSVALALIAGAITTQDPTYATFTRVVLTVIGALSAAGLVALLDAATHWSKTSDSSSIVIETN